MTFTIRDATSDDQQVLQRIQAQCPQGTGLRFTTVNTPDFFARARSYENVRVFVAELEGEIVASAACALREAPLANRFGTIGYEFQYFVAPAHRRKGLARALHGHIEDVLRAQGAALSYLITAEDNLPSMRLFEREGFEHYRTLRTPFLLPYRNMAAPGMGAVRPARSADLPAIVSLLNSTWSGFTLFTPLTVEALEKSLGRLQGFSLEENLLVLERNGGLAACVGYWDWRKVIAITVQALNPRLRLIRGTLNLLRKAFPTPALPGIGEPLTQWCLTPVGFTSPEALHAVLVTVNNLAVQERIGQLFLVGERNAPWFSALKGFFTADTWVHLYVKPLEKGISLPQGAPVFLDAVDL
ncbi:MAG: hypothetical protein Fur0018_25610 [Anaerolineales bacterium]